VLGYMNVAALRQHIRPEERIHGIFTRAGDKPNIVPDHTAAHWYVRARDLRRLDSLEQRVLACLEAGAAAAGCEIEHRWQEPAYADMVDNHAMSELYAANAARVGRTCLDPREARNVVGSTDMGNVSHRVPSIHPMIKVSPPNVSIHSPEFARYACSPEGDLAVTDGAKALAMTVVDLWCDPAALARARSEFAQSAASGA
jgi:metal-dependent amidase/aminoacylase/carboxypeptidase family protein